MADGDASALETLYRLTSAKLFGVCLRILKDRSEAEDVLQEVYLLIWRRAGAFDPLRGVSPVTWLATLARNKAIDRLRGRKTHLTRPVEDAAHIADGGEGAEAILAARQDEGRLNDCLDQLPERHGSWVRAAFFDGATYAALAQAAGAPLGTMKSWMRRSLLQLRTCLEA